MPENLGQTDGFNDHFSKWRDSFSFHPILVFVILTGLILIVIGCFFIFQKSSSDDKIEIIPAAEVITSQTLFADIAGEVVKPGVYELPLGSRINDLLIMAGGLSAKADRNWVETNLNKAQKLKDGDKVFIPQARDTSATKVSEAVVNGIVSGNSSTVSSKININTATIAELDTLWGVGQITAQKIIDKRPYQKIEDLVSKKVISQSIFQKISSQLSVY
jgi:competence protein ComEA